MAKIKSFLIATTFALLAFMIPAITANAEVVTDVTGPTITEVYCDQQGQVLSPGDTVYFSFKAYDENGLRNEVRVDFYEATSYSERSFNWVYNSDEDKFETAFTIPSSAKNGDYYISTIYMYDTLGNQTALNTYLGFRVVDGISDTKGPTITEVYCDQQGQVLKPGDTVYFSFKAYDESGLRDEVSVDFYEATSYNGRSFNWVYNSSEGKYEAAFTIPSSATNGEYFISKIYVYDIHGNQATLSTYLGFYIEPDGHVFGNWSTLDSNYHKRICAICKKPEIALHSGGSATCTEPAKCEICSQPYGDLNTDNHTADISWTSADGQHYHLCANGCDVRFDVANCADNDKDHKCDVCSADMGAHEAAAGKHTCDYCGQAVTECKDDDKDHMCDICSAEMGTHEAAAGKHTCDHCGQTITECNDEDKDHLCDVCATDMGTHEPALGTHTCDYCGNTITECVDENKDHKCDTCQTAMGTHEAASGKHTCDYCGKTVTECADSSEDDDSQCDICGKNVGDCVDTNKNHLCDRHGETMGTHETALGKHTCDYCGAKMTECADSNKDHKCDTCEATVDTHEAAAGKHTCDYCGKTVTECTDENKDHQCDICQTSMGTHEAAIGKHTCDYCNQAVTECKDGNMDHKCDVCNASMSTEVPETTPETAPDSGSDSNSDEETQNTDSIVISILGIVILIGFGCIMFIKKKE